MMWQPIETAPKDGTRILLYWPLFCASNAPGDFRRIECGAWNVDRYAKNPRPYWEGDARNLFGVGAYRANAPTLWLPVVMP